MLKFLVNMYGLFFLKDKKGLTVTNAFSKIFDNSRHKPNDTWIDKKKRILQYINETKITRLWYINVFNA